MQIADVNIPQGRTITNAIVIAQHVDLAGDPGTAAGEEQITMQCSDGLTMWEVIGMLEMMKVQLQERARQV